MDTPPRAAAGGGVAASAAAGRALQWRWRRRGCRAGRGSGRGGDVSMAAGWWRRSPSPWMLRPGAGAATSGPRFGRRRGRGLAPGAGSGPATGGPHHGCSPGAAARAPARAPSATRALVVVVRGWFARLDASGEGQKTVPEHDGGPHGHVEVVAGPRALGDDALDAAAVREVLPHARDARDRLWRDHEVHHARWRRAGG